MLRHCLPEVPALRATDLDLSADQAVRLANIFSIEPAAVRSMALTKVAQSSRRLIGAKPLQSCLNCCPGHMDFRPILRSQLLGWRITCPLCGGLLRDERGREVTSPFRQYLQVALRGERLLDAEAERGRWTWASPVDIARLLLMRRIPRPLPREDELWRFRVLGAIIPELDALVAGERGSLPTSGNPILPLRLRAALLAGVAIVEHAGPEMLRMLHNHTIGANRGRFADLAERMIGDARRPRAMSQMQLI
jgi:hypothetical protein